MDETSRPMGYLLSYGDGTDGVSYTYDQANGLATIVDASGTINVGENNANPKTINLYTYGAGDPIDNADPRGASIFGNIAGAAASFVAGVGSAFSAAAAGFDAAASYAEGSLAGAGYAYLGGVTTGFFGITAVAALGYAAYLGYQAANSWVSGPP